MQQHIKHEFPQISVAEIPRNYIFPFPRAPIGARKRKMKAEEKRRRLLLSREKNRNPEPQRAFQLEFPF